MYNVLVDENILVGVKILVVSVIDKDQGLNGEIIYYFDDMDSDLKFFDLNLIIGVIRI